MAAGSQRQAPQRADGEVANPRHTTRWTGLFLCDGEQDATQRLRTKRCGGKQTALTLAGTTERGATKSLQPTGHTSSPVVPEIHLYNSTVKDTNDKVFSLTRT